jgi:hypothetical protein
LEIQRQTGVVAKELSSLGEPPQGAAHIWDWFCDISRGRSSGFGVSAIAWADVDAYMRLRGIKPMWWEVNLIRELDDAFIKSRAEESSGGLKDAQAMGQVMTGQKRG